jgi:hypothetical protein
MSEIRKKTHPDRIELVYSGEYFSRLEQIKNVNMKFIFNSIF